MREILYLWNLIFLSLQSYMRTKSNCDGGIRQNISIKTRRGRFKKTLEGYLYKNLYGFIDDQMIEQKINKNEKKYFHRNPKEEIRENFREIFILMRF